MGLFDFLSSKKKKRRGAAGDEPAPVQELGDVEALGIDPPETRYTQEYKDYLASLEAEKRLTPDDAGDSTDAE
ncbi:MAG: hypothetical protein IKP17_04080 [Oscillospiraceae bacterium]|nr:hypothetical protein [Oscillospiraceae bacterium]